MADSNIITYDATHRILNKDGMWETDRRPYYRQYHEKNKAARQERNRNRIREILANPETRAEYKERQRQRREAMLELYGMGPNKFLTVRKQIRDELKTKDREFVLQAYARHGLLTVREKEYLARRKPIRRDKFKMAAE